MRLKIQQLESELGQTRITSMTYSQQISQLKDQLTQAHNRPTTMVNSDEALVAQLRTQIRTLEAEMAGSK